MGMGNRISDSGYSFLKITVNQLVSSGYDLFVENFKETGFLELEHIDLDIQKYLLLENKGFLSIIGVLKYNKIIGYAILANDKFIHSKEINYIKIDTLFISKQYRSLILFKSLLQYVEEYVRSYKVHYLFISSSVKRKLDKLLTKYNYKPIETLFCKEL